MGHHSAAQISSYEEEGDHRSEKPRLIMVIVGILLFVAGFLVTLEAIHGDNSAAASGGSLTEDTDASSSIPRSLYLLSGILVSLAGVVLATVGPAAGMFRRSS